MDVAQLPGQQNAQEQQNGKTHSQRQRPGHAAGLGGAGRIAAQHEKQGGRQAAQNGHESNDHEVCHGGDYRVRPGLKRALVAIAALAAVLLTLGLGRWQLQRADEKLALAAAMSQRAAEPALTGLDWMARPADAATLYLPVHLQGRWLANTTVYLDNRQMQARVGFYVFSAFLPVGSQAAVMVQRGWAPRNFEDRSVLPAVETPEGQVEIDGHLAPPPSKLYEPGEPSVGVIRQNLDLALFQQQIGQPVLTRLTVVQTDSASEGLLREWPEINLGVDKHYGYAAQWFALAALVVLLYAWFQVRPFVLSLKDSHV
jgi:surfeit locus 1 family protein